MMSRERNDYESYRTNLIPNKWDTTPSLPRSWLDSAKHYVFASSADWLLLVTQGTVSQRGCLSAVSSAEHAERSQ